MKSNKIILIILTIYGSITPKEYSLQHLGNHMDSTVIIIFFLSLMDILHSTKQREIDQSNALVGFACCLIGQNTAGIPRPGGV